MGLNASLSARSLSSGTVLNAMHLDSLGFINTKAVLMHFASDKQFKTLNVLRHHCYKKYSSQRVYIIYKCKSKQIHHSQIKNTGVLRSCLPVLLQQNLR